MNLQFKHLKVQSEKVHVTLPITKMLVNSRVTVQCKTLEFSTEVSYIIHNWECYNKVKKLKVKSSAITKLLSDAL